MNISKVWLWLSNDILVVGKESRRFLLANTKLKVAVICGI